MATLSMFALKYCGFPHIICIWKEFQYIWRIRGELEGHGGNFCGGT